MEHRQWLSARQSRLGHVKSSFEAWGKIAEKGRYDRSYARGPKGKSKKPYHLKAHPEHHLFATPGGMSIWPRFAAGARRAIGMMSNEDRRELRLHGFIAPKIQVRS